MHRDRIELYAHDGRERLQRPRLDAQLRPGVTGSW